MKVDICASMLHYWRHIRPVWDALPVELRGDGEAGRCYPDPGNVGLVASWADTEAIRNVAPYFYIEHGAGQAYLGDAKTAEQPGYSGSGGYRHIGCLGFICPSQRVADRWKTAPAVSVGCPKLDQYCGRPRPPVTNICFAFHWEGPGGMAISPEARSAFVHYQSVLAETVSWLEDEEINVFGHTHPKWEGRLDALMERSGMTMLEDETDVFELCGSLVMDNSSLMYEFAALARPVIALNAPWYRRDVQHGLRFWDAVPGIQVDDPGDLFPTIVHHLDSPENRLLGVLAAAHAYDYFRISSELAAEFVVARLRETGRL